MLYVGHPRRKKRDDGHWWDIYCDPIHETCEFEYVHLEQPYLLDHHQPARTEHLRYLDLITYASTIQRLLGIKRPTVPDEVATRLDAERHDLHEQFGVDVDLRSMTRETLHKRRTRLWLYRRLLERLEPKIVVVVVSYGKETLIEACKEQHIPVVELQHGVIYGGHPGYSFPGSRRKETFPDYLLTFGDFWRETVEYPIPDERIFPVGYPYLEQAIERDADVKSNDQILFVSQGTIGAQLSKVALAVDRHPAIDFDVVYKLHPSEYDRWKTEYPWLVDTNVDVVDDSNRRLHRLFAESSVQVGVGSTAVYEGLCFDLETYVYDCPGSDILQPLIDEGAAELVHSMDELVSSLGRGSGEFDCKRFFSPNATERVHETLEMLLADRTRVAGDVRPIGQ